TLFLKTDLPEKVSLGVAGLQTEEVLDNFVFLVASGTSANNPELRAKVITTNNKIFVLIGTPTLTLALTNVFCFEGIRF
ncbi:MAG: hypothetical protein QG603_752, partial [Patescibacteria group bacterium]|nr:hypothetical protein [Patescibacteria group bacterium]